MKIVGEVVELPVEALTPNKWNPNVQSEFMFERELESIKRLGFIDDVTVRVVGSKTKPRYEIIDGEHRWKAAKALGMETVSARNLGRIPDTQAKLITQALNRIHGEDDTIKRDRLIKSILDDDATFRAVLPYTESELQIMMEGFDWDSLSSKEDNAQDGQHTFSVKVTTEQKSIIRKAIDMASATAQEMSPGKALAQVCSAYIHARDASGEE